MNTMSSQPTGQAKPFYFLTRWRWLAIVCLFICTPLGLVLVWINDRFQKFTKIILSLIFGAIFSIFLLCDIVAKFSDESAPSNIDSSASSPLKSPTNERGIPTELIVEIQCNVEPKSDDISVSGSTNLPEGTALRISVDTEIDDSTVERSQKTFVTDGRFSTHLAPEGGGYPAGKYTLRVTVAPSGLQTPVVKEQIGKNSVNLKGALVSYSGGVRSVSFEKTFRIEDKQSLELRDQLISQAGSYSQQFWTLYRELMKFKDDPAFHDVGFSPAGKIYREWLEKAEALRDQKAPSGTAGLASSYLVPLALEYRTQSGRETEYSRMAQRQIKVYLDQRSGDQ